MGWTMVEGLNRFLENIRADKGVSVKGSFFVFQQNSEALKFGNLTKVTWRVHYSTGLPATPIELSVTAKVGRDDYKRDLAVMLQQEICKLVQSNKWEKIVNGKSI